MFSRFGLWRLTTARSPARLLAGYRTFASTSLRPILLSRVGSIDFSPGAARGISPVARKPQTTTDETIGDVAQSDKSTKKAVFIKPKAKRPKKLVPPKRPMNIMQLVTQDVISEIKARDGKLSKEAAREAFTIAAERHRLLTEREKRNYEDRLEELRERYEVDMRQFLDSLTPDDYINHNEYIRRRKAQGRSSNRKGIPKFDPNAPKRPLNGFMIFCSDLRVNPQKFPEFDELPNSLKSAATKGVSAAIEGSKALANCWRNLREDVKQAYIAEGKRRSDIYKQAKAQYDAQAKAIVDQLRQTKLM